LLHSRKENDMTTNEAKKFLENLPDEAVLIYDTLWSGPSISALTDKLDKLAKDAAAASEAIKSLKIYKSAA